MSTRSKPPFVLLVNPWITDFAAYDLWAKPLGLLVLAALFRQGGYRVALVDCLDRHDPDTAARPDVIPGGDRLYGTGKYPKMPRPTPEIFGDFPRTFYRYGMHPESFRKKLQSLPRPDLVCVTSSMTYWYPGVTEAIAHIRDIFPEAPVWLGGIYARLCPEHARKTCGADRVCTEPLIQTAARAEALLGHPLSNRPQWASPADFPLPALDLIPRLSYGPVLTSLGCPYRCPYCASWRLQPERITFPVRHVTRQILHVHDRTGVQDFAFYDDALLLGNPGIRPALEGLIQEDRSLRFHTPNALHVRALVDPHWCRLLYRSGFTTIRLGLETTRPDKQRAWGGKVEQDMFFRAVENLHRAGFRGEQIGAYLLCGMPDQTVQEVAEAIETVRRAGAMPHLAEYSPIPGTAAWRQAVRISPFPIETEPLTHNNTFFACRRPDFTLQDLQELKRLALEARRHGNRKD
ncbi:Radical SAM superfamily enzyme YgiQ, UPF0313 family [Desulfacinum hydrothermale DSM 13146]|uniref:Radical SAM superfamily enzyme YgiQ, UPF0313 family n=1 Tax=Desulfacinum hydrothermale DSM 13146 TaxID=1121390 RepID=A0A1W1XF18_9BACT|nr:B12-binding domain-containing radical SAM protein [Desulfacinum hydrothermale]SMC22500.1 Radical SAM superfamily enzyme YgiQ, UPF0313 family [Desulfacinum hydrothermale DSM 13146]